MYTLTTYNFSKSIKKNELEKIEKNIKKVVYLLIFWSSPCFQLIYFPRQHEDVTTALSVWPVLPWVDYVVARYHSVHSSQSSEVALYNPSSVGGSYFQFLVRDITALSWTPVLKLTRQIGSVEKTNFSDVILLY